MPILYMMVRFSCQELDPPEAVDLVTEAKIKVPSKITQPDEDNDKTTVGTKQNPSYNRLQVTEEHTANFISGVFAFCHSSHKLYRSFASLLRDMLHEALLCPLPPKVRNLMWL